MRLLGARPVAASEHEGVSDDARLPADPALLAAARPQVHETHASIVFVFGDRAVKLKKPILLPFVDWRTVSERAAACEREVALNRRLAPDVYLGVAAISGPEGAVIDHLVVMARMPEDRSLAHLLTAGVDLRQSLEDLAAYLAAFHARADRSPAIDAAASPQAVARNWEDNLAVLTEPSAQLDRVALARVDELAHRYLSGRGPLFAERAAAGMAVDGHGDLLADDIYLLEDGPRVLDCLEFDDRLRAVDVLDDVAFLAMDLEHRGGAALAASFLSAYRRHSGTEYPASLADHYVAYRAGVRAKVACIRASQGDGDARREAGDLLDLARRHLEAGKVRLVLVGGLPGTGKSTLARRLGEHTGWVVLSSDLVRKQLVGVPPSSPMAARFGEGIYEPHVTAATYEELLASARRRLEHGESVILDASWTAARWRAEAVVTAEAAAAELSQLCCVAPAAIAAERLHQRPAHDASDADAAIAAAMAAGAAPWPEATVIDTSGAITAGEAQALRALGLVAA